MGNRLTMLGIIEPGSVLGHATQYSGGPRLVTAVCAQPSVILEVSESAVDRVAAKWPELWRAIAGVAYENTRKALGLAAEVVSLRPRARVAARLLAISKRDPLTGTYSVMISQELLGEMIGVTRKTINVHLSAFERAGLIRVSYGRIDLCDVPGLQAIAHG